MSTFFFDLGSPFVHLAAARLEPLGFGDARWQPVALGALFKYARRSSWARSPRREAGMADVEARARVYGLPPIRWPEGWPANYLRANRAAQAAAAHGATETFARAALALAFAEAADLGDDAVIAEAARRAGLDADALLARAGDQDVKDRLRAATDAAYAAGVRGVPTLATDGALYWGDDQLEIAAAAAAAGDGAPGPDVAAEIRALEQRLMEAVRDRDMPCLEEVLGERFTLTTGRPGAEVRARDEWLRVTAAEYEVDEFAFEELEVDAYPAAAVARSRYRQRGRMGGEDRTQAFRITDVWIAEPDGWRLASRHSQPL